MADDVLAKGRASVAESPLLPGPTGPAGPLSDDVVVIDGWLVSATPSPPGAPLRLTDLCPEGKLLIRAEFAGPFADELGVDVGRAELFDDGLLVASVAPGEWVALSPNRAPPLAAGFAQLSPEELVTTTDVTHGLGVMRLTGWAAPEVLAVVAGPAANPARLSDGDALAAPVAGARTMVVRDDLVASDVGIEARGNEHPAATSGGGPDGPGPDGPELVPSFLLVCDRSQCAGLFERLLEAGRPWGIVAEGYAAYRSYHPDA